MKPTSLNAVLEAISNKPIKVIDANIAIDAYVKIDLSSENEALESLDVSSSAAWEHYVSEYLKNHKASVAYGGYLEKRDIYKRSASFSDTNPENERNIHLGIDLWSDAGTAVLAVLDGEIHSFQNNTSYGNYGPTIILKHTINDVEFYSLYGHLSLNAISNLKVGDPMIQGQKIGTLGDATVNGDYAPHLHFQLIQDIGANFGDYPGVTNKKELLFYSENCPNPNLLLKLT